MRFKHWLLSSESAATSIYHGGIADFPTSYTNVNMPVRSKWVTQDGSRNQDTGGPEVKPDRLFGFRSPEEKNRTRERKQQYIDKKRRGVPVTRFPPDTIY